MKKLGPLHVDPGGWIDLLREKGALKVRLKNEFIEMELQFEPSAAPPLVDEKGKAVNLDDGMPWNAADPADIDAKIEAANFNPQPKGAQPVVPIEAEDE